MDAMTVTFKTITPMFLAGAEPDKRAELRVPSIKGAMRFWYRTIAPNYKTNEPKIFGSTDEGQGGFLVRILENYKAENREWDPSRYDNDLFNCIHPKFNASKRHNKKTWQLNGIKYLAYSLSMNKRIYIPAGKEIKLLFTLRPNAHPDCKMALLSSLWLLGHVGGLGSRSRRGFGTVALQSWEWADKSSIELPISHSANSPEKWLEQFQKGLNMIKDWFKGERVVDHTVFGSNTKFYLLNGVAGETEEGKSFEPWEMALAEAGLVMQEFRQRWDLKDTNSDYYRVKQHLSKKHNVTVAGLSPQYLELNKSAPERTAFGLPLTFRYGNAHPITFQGVEHERSASPLFIRIVEINGKCHPFFALLNAPLLAPNEKVADKEDVRKAKKNSTPLKYSYQPPTNKILQKFCTSEIEPKALKVLW